MSSLLRSLRRKLGPARFRIAADNARERRDWAAAADLYERYLIARPDDVGIRVQAGHMRKEACDLTAAESHYLRAKAVDPDDADLNLQLGHFYKRAGRMLESLAAYQQAVELDASSAHAAEELANMRRRVRNKMGAPDDDTMAKERETLDKAIAALTIGEIADSGLFDAGWYLKTNVDVSKLGLDPLRHFFLDGRAEGRRPGPSFEPDWYLATYPEVALLGVEPFAHYLVAGRYQGMRPAGPPMYERWTAMFDTLGESDFRQIDAHIREVRLAQPDVVLAVSAGDAKWFTRTVRGVRNQRLKPRLVCVCPAPGVSSGVLRDIEAAVGSDPLFRIVSADDKLAARADDQVDPHRIAPVILLSAGVELREHALYLLSLAGLSGAAFAYGDEDRIEANGVRTRPFFKPDASPLLQAQTDYVGGCVLLLGAVTTLAQALLRGAAATDLASAAFFATNRSVIAHLPHILSHDHRSPLAEQRPPAGMLPVALADADLPSVTVIVPTRDRVELLSVCIESLLDRTDYPLALLDIVVVDNGSTDPATLDYLAAAGARGFRVTRDPSPFNYARLNNYAARSLVSDVLVLLNNDTEVGDPAWLRGLMRYAVLTDVGAVGPKLLYDDGTIQHAGVVLGIGVAAAHAHLGIAHDAPGDYGFAQRTREVAAVTGACLAIRRSVFEQLGGLDEGLAIAFNDVDLCLAAVQAGYRNIYVHDIWLRHFESKSRGVDDTPAKVDIFIGEANHARRKHGELFGADPFYNPNLSVTLESFYGPAFPPRCTYPWRDHHRSKRGPRVLLLASLDSPKSEIGHVVANQAAYLSERGYDVVVGAPGTDPRFETHARIRRAAIRDQQAAAAYAVANDMDCIVSHTAGYAGVSRLLGQRPRTIIQHHGFAAEAEAVGRVGREDLVAIRLALPAASAVLASSMEAASELEDDAILLVPGGDRLGCWTQASTAPRNRVREKLEWAGKVVILAETAKGRNASIYREVAQRLNRDKVALVDIADSGMTELESVADRGLDLADLLAAADLYWPMHSGSALALAEAASFGLGIIPPAEVASDAAAIAGTLSGLTATAGLPSTWDRRATGDSWTQSLDRFHAILVVAADIDIPDRRSAHMLLAPGPLIEDSGLFDEAIYRHFNPDVVAAKVDPWEHYLDHGAAEGRRGSFLFDGAWYLARYPDVAAANIAPLAHYLAMPFGDYDPNPYFSNAFYRAAYPDVASTGLSPLVHYLRIGARECRSLGPGFNSDFYVAAYGDVAGSGMIPYVHFMTVGDAEGRLPVKPSLTPMDIFNDAAVMRATGRPIAESVPMDGPITHRLGAARFCIHLLRTRGDLRARFPDALSAGREGDFARWIIGDGAAELDLSARDIHFIGTLLSSNFDARLRQARLVRTDLQRRLPFAFLPEGKGELLRWAVETGVPQEGFSLEEVWWLLLICAENPERELWTTYAFTPAWQAAVPDAETVFGDARFRAWIRDLFGIAGGAPDHRIDRHSPGEAIRIAYNARPVWRSAHPAAFSSFEAADAFLAWLDTAAADVPAAGRAWLGAQEPGALTADMLVPGVNMIGHFCYPSGLRVSTISLVRGCREVGLRVSERDVWVQQPGDEPRHIDYRGPEIYDKTILLCQPEPLFDTAFTRAGLIAREKRPYRIGYWYWEQDEIPDLWIDKARELDEVWTSTNFVGDALKAKLDVPVQVIPHGIEVPPFEHKPRAYFGLPEDHYLFLFTFHMMSVMERKNPLGLIQAFAREFKPEEKVSLVLKTSFGDYHPQQMEEMRRAATGANILIIDSVYTHNEVLALMEACDCYISLHRSEGFGLTMAEAMLIGKPTIATGYSANLDFMSADNSLLVEYDLVRLGRDYPPYVAGSRWANASVRHASQCMRRVQSDPAWGQVLGAKARFDLEQNFSFAASGQKIAARLAEIDSERKARNRAD